jgi:hypothetical protein
MHNVFTCEVVSLLLLILNGRHVDTEESIIQDQTEWNLITFPTVRVYFCVAMKIDHKIAIFDRRFVSPHNNCNHPPTHKECPRCLRATNETLSLFAMVW